jgi:hypothetical protein
VIVASLGWASNQVFRPESDLFDFAICGNISVYFRTFRSCDSDCDFDKLFPVNEIDRIKDCKSIWIWCPLLYTVGNFSSKL